MCQTAALNFFSIYRQAINKLLNSQIYFRPYIHLRPTHDLYKTKNDLY